MLIPGHNPWMPASCRGLPRDIGRRADSGRLFRRHGGISIGAQLRLGLLSAAGRHDMVFCRHCFSWASEARISPCTRFGCPNSIRRSAAAAPSPSPLPSAGLSARDLRSGRRRGIALPYHRHPRGAHGDSFHPRPFPAPVRLGDHRPAPAGLGLTADSAVSRTAVTLLFASREIIG